ncbi:hypothetical protein P1J78_11865 [Psychromarinibacter sp. C21-152]|uniref:Uncharacterized protein n=1 Tax=Psychromarinibacter sediminicola TaxID=3033385 RepID=A0AAE3NS48_9RHOB|nr:hypothetical protein [Psychromarinibacter sediminicola]MDF0601431.1 hypothetical protein [Psychromarinibacter sediminicola]
MGDEGGAFQRGAGHERGDGPEGQPAHGRGRIEADEDRGDQDDGDAGRTGLGQRKGHVAAAFGGGHPGLGAADQLAGLLRGDGVVQFDLARHGQNDRAEQRLQHRAVAVEFLGPAAGHGDGALLPAPGDQPQRQAAVDAERGDQVRLRRVGGEIGQHGAVLPRDGGEERRARDQPPGQEDVAEPGVHLGLPVQRGTPVAGRQRAGGDEHLPQPWPRCPRGPERRRVAGRFDAVQVRGLLHGKAFRDIARRLVELR